MTTDKNAHSADLSQIVESAKRLGIELDEAEAMQWLTAMAATEGQQSIVTDEKTGAFGPEEADKYFLNTLNGLRYPGTSGSLYAVPYEWVTIVFYYNKDIFDEVGIEYPTDEWTWDDLLAAAEADAESIATSSSSTRSAATVDRARGRALAAR